MQKEEANAPTEIATLKAELESVAAGKSWFGKEKHLVEQVKEARVEAQLQQVEDDKVTIAPAIGPMSNSKGCSSCDLVPCGQCQQGCHESLCSGNGAESRNGCDNNNAGWFPATCDDNTVQESAVVAKDDLKSTPAQTD